MKIAPLIAATLVLCITLPGDIVAKKKPKPKPSSKYCHGKDGNRYQIGQEYLDTEECILYTCKRVKKRATMIEKKLPKPCTDDCQHGIGEDYSGFVSKTMSGLPCQKWTSQSPHEHDFGSLGDHNYCRNPDGDPGVWCYTTNPDVRHELCDVPVCENPSSPSSPLVTPTPLATTESQDNLVMKMTELEKKVHSIIAALDTKCDATTCSSIQDSTTDIETCLGDVSSSDCPSSPSGKTGLAVALAGASTCDTSEIIDSLTITDSNYCSGHICPPGISGPGGCCPRINWYCCSDGWHCAIDKRFCPQETAANLIITDSDACSGTMCPGGCCPRKNWYCCPDGLHCAANPKFCPAEKAANLTIMDSDACSGTMCPGGCCPKKNWYCCSDGLHCAAKQSDCPAEKAVSLTITDSDYCSGHICPPGISGPGGCCPRINWYCCSDGWHCAIDKRFCPQETGDHNPKLPPWCYYHPGCNINQYCEWGYHCTHDNYCCRNYDYYGNISSITEQDALNYSLAYTGPVEDSNFAAGFHQKIADQNTVMDLNCQFGYTLYIKSAKYTKVGDASCTPHPTEDYDIVEDMCQTQQSCAITVNDEVFAPNPCPGVPKTLTVWYKCTGLESLDFQEFQDFEKKAIKNFEYEIANVGCSNIGNSTLSHGNCGIISWAKCLKYGYKDYQECKTICKGEYTCMIACIIKKLDTHPKCKGCIKALMKAICCHFISKCCDMTDEDFEASYNISAATAPVCHTVSEFSIMAISCTPGTAINVTSALYGRAGVNSCEGQSSVTSENIVKSYCQGDESCNVPANNSVFGMINCGFQNPVLQVCHTCD